MLHVGATKLVQGYMQNISKGRTCLSFLLVWFGLCVAGHFLVLGVLNVLFGMGFSDHCVVRVAFRYFATTRLRTTAVKQPAEKPLRSQDVAKESAQFQRVGSQESKIVTCPSATRRLRGGQVETCNITNRERMLTDTKKHAWLCHWWKEITGSKNNPFFLLLSIFIFYYY